MLLSALLCCALLFCALLCCAVLCCVVLWLCCAVLHPALFCSGSGSGSAVLRCALLCCVLLCSAVLCSCSALLCCALLCCVLLCFAVLCCAMLFCALLCCAPSCSAVPCGVVLCRAVLCSVLPCPLFSALLRQFTIHPHPCGTPRVRLVGQPRFACLSEQYVNGTAGAMPIMNRTESISTSCDSFAFPVALVSNANGNDPLLEQRSSCVHVLSQNPKWRVANWFPYGFKAS